MWLQHQREGVHPVSILQHRHPPAEDIFQHLTLFDKGKGLGRMDITNEETTLITFPVVAHGSHDTPVQFYQLLHLSATDHVTAHVSDVIHHGAHNHAAVPSQSPAALDIALLAVGEGKERQRLTS